VVFFPPLGASGFLFAFSFFLSGFDFLPTVTLLHHFHSSRVNLHADG
jgi:hypothetical protein